MVQRIAWLLLLILPLLATARPAPTLAAAHHARRMLGDEVWSQVLRIENTNPRSEYPSTVYATVFEAGGILWFYTGMDGTQSLSLHRGRLAEEQREIARLLLQIDPGFTHHEVMPLAAIEFAGGRQQLPEGCFIESLAALHDLLARDVPIRQARLLVYYLEHQGRMRGHTVLIYETDAGVFVLDRTRRNKPRPIDGALADAMAVAREVEQDRFAGSIFRARWLPLIEPTEIRGPAYVDLHPKPASSRVTG